MIQRDLLQPRRFQSLDDALLSLAPMDQECIIVRHRLSPGETISEHFHPRASEWVLLSRGSLEISINGCKKSLHLNGDTQAISFPAGSKHSLKAVSELEYWVLRDRNDEIIYTDPSNHPGVSGS